MRVRRGGIRRARVQGFVHTKGAIGARAALAAALRAVVAIAARALVVAGEFHVRARAALAPDARVLLWAQVAGGGRAVEKKSVGADAGPARGVVVAQARGAVPSRAVLVSLAWDALAVGVKSVAWEALAGVGVWAGDGVGWAGAAPELSHAPGFCVVDDEDETAAEAWKPGLGVGCCCRHGR